MNTVQRSTGRWYCGAMALLLAAEAAGWTALGPLAAALGLVQVAHYRIREGALRAFPVQVRLAYLVLLAAGLWPPLAFIHWVQLAGTVALLAAGYCPLARLMALLPWNRREPLSAALVARAFLTPPGEGTILAALYGGAGRRPERAAAIR